MLACALLDIINCPYPPTRVGLCVFERECGWVGEWGIQWAAGGWAGVLLGVGEGMGG